MKSERLRHERKAGGKASMNEKQIARKAEPFRKSGGRAVVKGH